MKKTRSVRDTLTRCKSTLQSDGHRGTAIRGPKRGPKQGFPACAIRITARVLSPNLPSSPLASEGQPYGAPNGAPNRISLHAPSGARRGFICASGPPG